MTPHNKTQFWLVLIAALHLGAFHAEGVNVIYKNTGFITVLDTSSPPTMANPYPSSILVASPSSVRVAKVTVKLIGVNHTSPDDLDIMLVGPNGERVLLMSDCGGTEEVNGLTLEFSDDATNALPNGAGLRSGFFQPTDFNLSDAFPAPAGGGATASNLAAFNGISPNGTWSLYVVDDGNTDAGSIAGGWSLSFDLTARGEGGPTTIIPAGSASPYPNSINFSNLSGVVTKLTVALLNFAHEVPDDVDILLVAPNGTNLVLMSDVGGSIGVTNINLVFDSAATNLLLNTGPIVSGTYTPRNFGGGDTFSAPAPTPSPGNNLDIFQGTNPNGEWNLYVMDDVGTFGGSIANWRLNLELSAPAQPGNLLISEFRTRGLTPGGTNNEFVEIYNNTDEDHTVTAINGSSGYALVASDGATRFIITNGTVIPARGHFLGVNSSGYSLTNYPAGNGQGARGDATFTLSLPDNPGLALFRSTNISDFVLSNRLDAVGATVVDSLYREGVGYTPGTPGFNTDHTFYRNLTNGVAKDTDDNVADFLYADTEGTASSGQQRLGAAGPENLSSPIHLSNGPALVRMALDTGRLNAPVNNIRDFTPNPAQNSTRGTLSFRRQFINNLGQDITQLRFRIVELATFPSTLADMRALNSGNVNLLLSNEMRMVYGARLDQPPGQLNGGGFNSSFSLTNISVTNPLSNGATINAQFTFGLQATGTFRVSMMAETLPPSASDVWSISGNTDSTNFVEGESSAVQILNLAAIRAQEKVRFRGSAGRAFQLQRADELSSATNWTNVGLPVFGYGGILEATHQGGVGLTQQFYRIKVVP